MSPEQFRQTSSAWISVEGARVHSGAIDDELAGRGQLQHPANGGEALLIDHSIPQPALTMPCVIVR